VPEITRLITFLDDEQQRAAGALMYEVIVSTSHPKKSARAKRIIEGDWSRRVERPENTRCSR